MNKDYLKYHSSIEDINDQIKHFGRSITSDYNLDIMLKKSHILESLCRSAKDLEDAKRNAQIVELEEHEKEVMEKRFEEHRRFSEEQILAVKKQASIVKLVPKSKAKPKAKTKRVKKAKE